MSSSSNPIDNIQNGRTSLLRNIQRSALNNVTNTTLSQENVSQQSVVRTLKSSLTLAKREGSKIPQYKKDTYPDPSSHGTSLTNSNSSFNIKEIASKNITNLSTENKENLDPFPTSSNVVNSKNLPSIEEEQEHEVSKNLSGHITSNNQEASSLQDKQSEYQSTQEELVNYQKDNHLDVDANKKRPISTVVEQDLPKKFKVCNEDGQEEYEWEDLDAEDANDPFMVSEYVTNIFDYLHHLEVITLPQKQDLFKHRNIHQNRDILVNWMIKIHNKFGLLPETLYLAINLMDRFLCKELVQLDKLQLVGTSCLFIASKYEEVYSPSIKHFASETDGACSEDEIKEGEKFILKTLEFNLNYPNPMNFLRRISKADDYDIQLRTLAKFLLEISLVDFRFIGILPSLCAAAAMFLSRKMLGKGKWDGNLIHYSGGYTTEQLAPVCQMMMDYLVSPIVHDEFHRKYQSRRFMKASIISVQWALKVRKNGYDIMTLHE
ncbi:hypothetical protein Kpol_1006p2 [Vanderwaltozyma polyspora DSM 70294]|uniref:Uncharacterized protein n=1 Tax=Vanderwaltozyma polyspora (strain ATCC 22028 / DSM 70294 / BCRC 21397 / CBS 2163 / NBRC 10782 / NRRL Y-8283 / UCD 57-17) TaxID=436907 RepID=A7TQ38_VANPO|nr:uncharacterized protein Kpol_1006p2 [Vanderwaltozyma polyspora DSM 70294]EDO15606.1 hypothetical protein Kpol_1006p2 [Vanderwaltozyma polyspora DSM 70294]